MHDSYDDQQEISRAFNHNEGNATISGCIPDYNSVNKPPMIISTSDITDAYDEITPWKKCFSGAIRENRKRLHRPNNDAYKLLEQQFGKSTFSVNAAFVATSRCWASKP